MILSFEAFVNGQVFEPLWSSGFDGRLTDGYKPPVYDVSNFGERVRAKLADLKELGVGGIVVYFDFTDDYLESEAGWQRFITGLRAAAELDLRIWIYDEKGYPSGTAGGKVLEDHPELEAMGIKQMIVENPEPGSTITIPDPRASVYQVFGVFPDGHRQRLYGRIGGRVVQVPDEQLTSIEAYFIAPLFEGTFAFAAGGRRYLNVLDRRAVNRFLQLTHVRYFKRIPADLWQHVDAFFTDEVALQSHADMPGGKPNYQGDPYDPNMPTYPSIPWSEELEERFAEGIWNGFQTPLQTAVSSLFNRRECGEGAKRMRRQFWQTVSRQYVSAYAQQATDVCAAMGVDTSGHMLGEDTILQQVILHGSLIQTLKAFARPGVDLLSCRIEDFHRDLLTHKTAQSASFFGSGKGVMTETSDYFESANAANRVLLPPEDIKCVLAMQYLLGVRDFCLLFALDRFTPEVHKDICGFISRLVDLGEGCAYRPEFGLYYPIERMWEEYVPTHPAGDYCCASLNTGSVGVGSAKLLALDKLTTDTVKQLFHSNRQFVLCEKPDIASLPHRGIQRIVYYPEDIGLPLGLVAGSGVDITWLDRLNIEIPPSDIKAGPNVLYATYDGFVFALNTGRKPSHIEVPGSAKAVFPLIGDTAHQIDARVDLPPLACAFLYNV